MAPNPVYTRRPINLDKLFGNPLVNVTGEPITPTKIAIFYLVRTLFQAHFGVHAVPSLKPLNKNEKTKAFSILYGLVLMKSEVSYDAFRRIVRVLNNELGRSIYYHFVSSMEKVAYGEEQIEMLFENAFYTAKRPHHGNVLPLKNEEMTELTFMSSNSFLYIWIKRVMIEYTRTPQEMLFLIAENMQKWILSGNQEIVFNGIKMTLPFEIDCSIRARHWITRQLSLVQFSPTTAMPYNKILDWCHIICQRHHDIFEVNLLKAAVFVQLKNPPDAVKSLKTFFDLSMLQITESSTQALETLNLMAPCQAALRYGPILQGRVHRLFGDRNSAGLLFAESIQQSQLNVDDMCNRIANMELTINSILMSGPILERLAGQTYSSRNEKKEDGNPKRTNDRRVLQNTIHAAADLNAPNIRSLQKSFKEDYELHTYLVSMSKFMLCIEDMMDGKYFKYNSTADYVSVGFHRLRLIYDAQNKGRAIEDFANAIMSSGLIQSGMFNQARRVAETMIVNNCAAPCCPKLEMESHAVAGVNLVYSLASVGDYDTAFKTILSLESMFPEDINWMAARHVTICSQIIRFEKDFLLNRYSACSNHLKGLQSTAPLEFILRKSLLLAVTGKLAEAVDLLNSYNSGDVRATMRIHMQLATINTAYGRFENAEHHLEEAGKTAINTHFRDANFLVTRRVGSMMLARFMPQDAYQVLMVLSAKVENFGTYIEKAIYYVSIARCLRLLDKDPRIHLKKCKSLIINNRWPAMEKLLLTELTILHHSNGMFPNEIKATWAKERFGKIEADFPGPCTWMFI